MDKVTTVIKGMVYNLPPEQQKKFDECVQQIVSTVKENGAEGVLALAFVGVLALAFVAAKIEEE